MKSRTFVDTVTVHLEAGKGGNGSASFRREKYVPQGGPDGGDGGRGGHVIVRGDKDIASLVHLYFQPHQRAEPGGNGKCQQQHGRNGRDCLLRVPLGTEIWTEDRTQLLADVVEDGAEFVLARGGKGGLGNCHFKSSTHQAPIEFTPGGEAVLMTVHMELKLLADLGLVGFPNAGKSSLLSCISHAHPKVAAYPFTTLNPVIGTMMFEDYTKLTVADIPGIIEGAHNGVGLGHEFLRHIERAYALVYLVDMAGVDGRQPWDDYRALRRELTLHEKLLADRPSIIVANKMDEPEAVANLKIFKRKIRKPVLPISALSGEGIDALHEALGTLCDAVRERYRLEIARAAVPSGRPD